MARQERELAQLLQSLEELEQIGAQTFVPADLQSVRELRVQLAARGRHGLGVTVVALAGGTGAGKSALFNAVAGVTLAKSTPLRPTTSQPLSLSGADHPQLLDWLEVPQRHVNEVLGRSLELRPDEARDLVLIDLPDVDSTSSEHRLLASRLAARADLVIWVLDPEKYADAILHEDFLQSLGQHDSTTLVVLNRIDAVPAADRDIVLADAQHRVNQSGLAVSVLATSAITGQGVADLRTRIASVVRDNCAALDSLLAHSRHLAQTLAPRYAITAAQGAQEHALSQDAALAQALVRAVGGAVVTQQARQRYEQVGKARTAFFLTAWRHRLSKNKLASLVGVGAPKPPMASDEERGQSDEHVQVSPRRSSSTTDAGLSVAPVAQSQAHNVQLQDAITKYVAARTQPLPQAWRALVERETYLDPQPLVQRAKNGFDWRKALADRYPRWWRVAQVWQSLCALSTLVGAGWLILNALSTTIGLRLPDPPAWGIFTVPLLLVTGGLLFGLLGSIVVAPLRRSGAQRYERQILKRLTSQASVFVRDFVTNKVDTTVAAAYRCTELLSSLGK